MNSLVEDDILPHSSVHVHYALVSGGYHLCNLNDIHFRSPIRSVLNPLTSKLGERVNRWNREEGRGRGEVVGDGFPHPRGLDEDGEGNNEDRNMWRKGWVTVEFVCAAYPFLEDGEDKATSFLGRCFLIGQELVPILVNIQGVVNKREVSVGRASEDTAGGKATTKAKCRLQT